MATYIVDVIRKLEQKVSFAVDAKNKAELDKKCKLYLPIEQLILTA